MTRAASRRGPGPEIPAGWPAHAGYRLAHGPRFPGYQAGRRGLALPRLPLPSHPRPRQDRRRDAPAIAG
ncbi:hypothetical protein G6F21_014342 [Rhizopus arrhizus]|nr:hypothetical protein G6F21_014342 [Rhizopus arrhizus]